jgi:hypothetical protein
MYSEKRKAICIFAIKKVKPGDEVIYNSYKNLKSQTYVIVWKKEKFICNVLLRDFKKHFKTISQIRDKKIGEILNG